MMEQGLVEPGYFKDQGDDAVEPSIEELEVKVNDDLSEAQQEEAFYAAYEAAFTEW